MLSADVSVLGGTRSRLSVFFYALLCSVGASAQACALEFALARDQGAVGAITTDVTRAEDTLMDIARANHVGYTELMAVNGDVDAWLPGHGKSVTIPGLHLLPDAPRTGVVINVAARRLFYFPPEGGRVETFPIAIGTLESETPTGTAKIVRGERLPTWYPTAQMRRKDPTLALAVPPGPKNPLGTFAFYLNWPAYLIHGTNMPDGIGRAVSHGCIQLYPEDIERLSKVVRIGTPVRIIKQEFAVAMVGDELYLEVHPSREQSEAIEINQTVKPKPPEGVKEKVKAVAKLYEANVDWAAVEKASAERTGLPVMIGHGKASLSRVLAQRDPDELYPTDLYFLP
jgi:L,D-transpeptidase ErfK/SrfK